MKRKPQRIDWPNNISSFADEGDDWFLLAKEVGLEIPTGCLSGSCGACEIDINGETIRPCIQNLRARKGVVYNIELTKDPFWE